MPEPKLTPAQFAKKLKAKYPQYADMDDAVLADNVLQKYPQYSDIVDFGNADAGEKLKKKEPSKASASQPSEKPSASATSGNGIPPIQRREPIQPTFVTQAPNIFGDGRPVAPRPTPTKAADQLSPAAKARIQQQVAQGLVEEAPAKKPEMPTEPSIPRPSSYLSFYEKEEFERADRVREAVYEAESELRDRKVGKSLSESFDVGWLPKQSVKVEDSEQVQDARKNANDVIRQTFGVDFDVYVPNENGVLVEDQERIGVVKNYLDKTSQYEQYINAQNTINEARRREQEDPNAFPLTSQLLNTVPESLGLASAFAFDAMGIGDTKAYSDEVRIKRMARRVALGIEDGKGITQNISEGNIGDAMKELMLAGADFVPQMAAFIINPLVGYAYNAASAGGSTYDQFRDRNDLSKGDKMTLALTSAAADFVLNKLTMGAEKSIRASLGIAADELGTEVAKKKALDYLNPLKNEVFTKGFLGEAAEEGGVNLINQIAASVIAGDDFDMNSLIDEALIGGVFGSAAVGVPKVLARGANGLANASMVSEFRKVTDEIKKINDALLNEKLTPAESALLTKDLERLSARQNEISNISEQLYAAMSKEDQDALYETHRQINEGLKTYNESDNDVVKRAVFKQVRDALIAKRDLENKYAGKVKTTQDDRKEEQQVSSPVVEGEAVVETQPVEGAGQETPEAGGVLQVPVEEKIADAERTRQEKANSFQEAGRESKDKDDGKILGQWILDNAKLGDTIVDEDGNGYEVTSISYDVTSINKRGDVELTAFEINENGEKEYITSEDGVRLVSKNKLSQGDLFEYAYFDLDGNKVIKQYKYNAKTDVDPSQLEGMTAAPAPVRVEAPTGPAVEKQIADIERRRQEATKKENIFLAVGNVPALTKDASGNDAAYSVGIYDENGKNKFPEVSNIYAATPQELIDKINAKYDAELAALKQPVQQTGEEVPVEQVKNRRGLSKEQIDKSVSRAEGLAKRLGLPTKIVTFNSRSEYNKAVNESSKTGLEKNSVEQGRFIPSTNEIYLNLEDMTAEVPFHEVFHAAFISKFAKSKQTVREKSALDFYNGISKILRNGNEQEKLLADSVDSFVQAGGYTAKESPEEFLAQTAGFLSTSGNKISKSTMDKLIQWLNNFIAKISPSLKINSRGEFIDFMNSFSGALFESSTDKSLEEIAEEGSYTPEQPATMPDLSEMSSKRTFAEDAPDFIKNNIANLKSLAGRKIPFAVFYDNTRVGKSTLKNSVTGKESDRKLMGGFGYSQIEGVKFDDNGPQVSVLAFTNEDMAARKLSEFLRKEGDLIPVAMQNTQTGHLGNLDVVYEMFDDVNGVVSTAPVLYAEKQTGKKSGPEFEAAKNEAEQEILDAIKQNVREIAAKTEKKPKKKDEPTNRVKAARRIEPMLDEITTLAEWRDKILLGEWNTFGTRGEFNAYMLRAKPSSITKATRETHKVLHGKYGVPTIKEIEDGVTEQAFSNAELGDVVKFVSPNKTAVIYTTDPIHKDLPKEGVQKKSDKMAYTLKYIGDQVDAHVSYPYILAGKNDGFAPSYIDITEIFPDLRGKVKKSQSFYAAGRRSLDAPVGELSESSSREIRAEILDRKQESRIDRAKRTATSFVWNPTQKKIRVFKERMNSQLSVEGREIKKFVKRLNKLLNESDVQTLDLVNKIFDGTLTPQDQLLLESKKDGKLIFGQANAMRNYIDSFANDFVNSPEFLSLPEETVNTIIDNFGKYMRGSYRFWKDKNFKPSDQARRDAIVYEYEIIRAKKIEQLVKKEGFNEEEAGEFFELLHDETLAEATSAIDAYIAEIEKIREGDDFKKLGIVSPSSIKLPSEQFTRRKNLPETIQALLGKENDPIIRFIDTAIALSNIKYKGQMLYAISESLGGTKFIKKEATEAEISSKEYREVKDKFSPLNGKYVHKDVYEAITDQKIYDAEHWFWKGYFNILKLARKSKVIYNIPTWRKNLTGGWYTMMANGVMNPEFVIDLKRRAELFYKGETDAETEALIKIMGDNGLIGQDVNANLLGFTSAIYSRALTGNDADYQTYVKQAKDVIKNFDAIIGQKYSAVDDYTKLVIFRSEIQSFAKKLYGKSYDSLTGAQKNKVHAEAAEFVKQNTPTFSRLPKWYASLARIPAGDFLSFELESLRSFGYNVFNGHKDIYKGMTDTSLSNEQKAEYIKSGSKRLIGSATILGARVAVNAILASLLLGDDDELQEDIKNNRPNWMDGHSIVPVKITEDGIATVYDYSMEDPYGSFFDLATDPLSFPAYVVDLLKPNMGVTFVMNLWDNKDFYGRDITNSYDDPLTKGFKYTDHTLRSLILPPFISSTLRDEQKRMEVEADKYSPLDGVGRFASRAIIRDYEYNIGTQFYFFTDQLRTKKEQYSDLTGASRANRLAELDEIKKMYQSIVNIGIKKGNYEMIANANKNVKRALKPLEEAYVLYGYELPEQE